MNELWSALCLVVVLEGLLLFAAPGGWKRSMARLLEMPDRSLRVFGGVLLVAGLLSLYWVRG